ncbi:M60 family metallopeptidase [Pedobacter frigoris]|uniref:Wall-associated protein n=1 Tax=Pedobacter frigoris TaxID=2571272 RepID=A0A4V5P259_9SPHI|nr:M60 family metallopeptidase [Pedobacter frigoris]TKC06918.1 wall-associated protein [Pedobacter frigoris]
MIKNHFTLFRLTIASCMVLAMGCKRNNLEQAESKSYKAEALAHSVEGNPAYASTLGTNVQEFNELPNIQAEFNRLKVRVPWTDYEATGIYVAPNTTFTLTVQQLTGTRLPTLLVGTKLRASDPGNPTEVQLTAGSNSISSGQYGGLLWVRYNTTQTPNGKVRITFNSGHQRAAVFFKNVTTQAVWTNQLSTYTAPDVLLVGNRVIQIISRSTAQTYQAQNNNFVISTADNIWDWETQISGLDGSAPQHQLPVHNRMLMVQTLFQAHWYGVAVNHATAYYPGATSEVFTPLIAQTQGWGVWHEFGHQMQQPSWYWGELTEVAVNIYSLKAERELGISPSRLKRDNIWPQVLTYLASTAPAKNFNSTTDKGNWAFTMLAMFHQLYLAYGDDFYIKLHKKTRVDNPSNTTEFQKMRYFMLSSCQVTGRNLTNFFRNWAFKTATVNGSAVSLESVYTEIANLGLPQPSVEPSTLTEDNVLPIQNGGIYKIATAINNTSLIDCNSSAPVNATPITLWTDNGGGNNQKWLARSAGSGYFIFKSLADTTKVMEVKNGTSTAGTVIQMYTANGTNAQKWKPTTTDNINYTLSPGNAPTLVLDVNNSSTANGTILKIWTSNGGTAQKFKFVKLN